MASSQELHGVRVELSPDGKNLGAFQMMDIEPLSKPWISSIYRSPLSVFQALGATHTHTYTHTPFPSHRALSTHYSV